MDKYKGRFLYRPFFIHLAVIPKSGRPSFPGNLSGLLSGLRYGSQAAAHRPGINPQAKGVRPLKGAMITLFLVGADLLYG